MLGALPTPSGCSPALSRSPSSASSSSAGWKSFAGASSSGTRRLASRGDVNYSDGHELDVLLPPKRGRVGVGVRHATPLRITRDPLPPAREQFVIASDFCSARATSPFQGEVEKRPRRHARNPFSDGYMLLQSL